MKMKGKSDDTVIYFPENLLELDFSFVSKLDP